MLDTFLYSPVPGSEKGGELSKPEILKVVRVSLFRLYIVVLHIFVVVSSILISWPELNNSSTPHKLLDREIPWAENIVQYEEVTFAPSGFAEGPTPATLYEGIPTPEIDARWAHLTSVGMYSLTTTEYNELDLNTVEEVKHPGQYLVTIEVFHQLHCLNYLRKAVYGNSNPKESDNSKSMHIAHCTDYLRQVLMCHGDLTLITLHQNLTRSPPYMPDFSIKHTCRNFDAIWEFAEKRNISGIRVE